MIQFKRGEFYGGDNAGIIVPDFDEHSGDDLFLNPLAEDCWILTIPSFEDKVQLISAMNTDFNFIPNEQDSAYDNYELFWESKLTIIFSSFDQALEYIRDYDGPYLEQLEELLANLLNPIDDAGHD